MRKFSAKEREAAVIAAREDFYFFVRWMFQQRKKFKWRRAKQHKVICDALMRVFRGECRRLIINIPPRYSKTEIAVVMFTAWAMGKCPDSEWIHTCYSGKLGITPDNRFIIGDITRMQGAPHEVESTLKNTADRDGSSVKISIPQDPGQAGKSQVAAFTRLLAGKTVTSSVESGDKVTRAEPFAAQVNVGKSRKAAEEIKQALNDVDVSRMRQGLAAVSEVLAEELCDTGVNMGPAVQAAMLQRWLNVFNQKGSLNPDLSADGQIGPRTITALQLYLKARGKEGGSALLKALNSSQAVRYLELAEQREANETFVYGWVANRVDLTA